MTRDYLQPVTEAVSAWEGVTTASHRFGGVEFNIGKVEIGHVHHGGMVDIPYTKKIRDALVADAQALPHHLLDASGWITFYVRGEEDVQQAIRLFRLSYLHKRYRRDRDDTTYQEELTRLGFNANIMSALPSAAL